MHLFEQRYWRIDVHFRREFTWSVSLFYAQFPHCQLHFYLLFGHEQTLWIWQQPWTCRCRRWDSKRIQTQSTRAHQHWSTCSRYRIQSRSRWETLSHSNERKCPWETSATSSITNDVSFNNNVPVSVLPIIMWRCIPVPRTWQKTWRQSICAWWFVTVSRQSCFDGSNFTTN